MSSNQDSTNNFQALLQATIHLAHDQQFQNKDTLQLWLWLCYKLIELDFRCESAYLGLAYLLYVLQESNKAFQILLHAEKTISDGKGIEQMLTQLRFAIEAPQAMSAHDEQQSAVKLLPFPELVELLEYSRLPQVDIKARYAQLKPVLNNLVGRLKESKTSEKRVNE